MITKINRFKRFGELEDAIYRYQSLDSDPEPLLRLMAEKPQVVRDYAEDTRKKLLKKYKSGTMPVTRGQGFNGNMAIGERIEVARICSFTEGLEPAREFAKSPIILHSHAPLELVFYHNSVGGGGFASEKEVIFLDVEMTITGFNSDVDSDTGDTIYNNVWVDVTKTPRWRW